VSFDGPAAAALRTTQRALCTTRAVVYAPAGLPTVSLDGRAIFREAHVEQVLAGEEVGVATVGPDLSIALADLPAEPAEGDGVLIAGAPYRVAGFEPDGEGGALLRLEAL